MSFKQPKILMYLKLDLLSSRDRSSFFLDYVRDGLIYGERYVLQIEWVANEGCSMRILAVCQNYWPEPFNTNEICEELARCGHEVTVLTGLPNYPEGEIPNEYKRGQHRDEIVNQVRVIRVPVVARGRDLHGINKVRRVLNYLSFPLDSWLTGAASRGRYDCVICFQFSPIQMALPALRLARSQGIPCLVYVYDLWPEDLLTGGFDREGLAYRAMRNVSRTIYSRADKIAVTSPKFAENPLLQ
ncbi:MAG: glycosyltransferase [Olsenella sp.]|nr:glycosyltransferase [Olsenella sp.]